MNLYFIWLMAVPVLLIRFKEMLHLGDLLMNDCEALSCMTCNVAINEHLYSI
jgi:hypothetical protein